MTWNMSGWVFAPGGLGEFLDESAPDILCLQELSDLSGLLHVARERGYEVMASNEVSRRHHLALSRWSGEELPVTNLCSPEERGRVIGFKANSIHFYSVLGPHAAEVDSPEFTDKIRFVEDFARAFVRIHGPEEKVVLLGSWQIAPLPDDVASIEDMREQVGYHSLEHRVWSKLLAAGFLDGVKPYVHSRTFCQWESAAESGRLDGQRTDHILVTESVQESVASAHIYADLRTKNMGCHVPVELVLDPALSMECNALFGGFQ